MECGRLCITDVEAARGGFGALAPEEAAAAANPNLLATSQCEESNSFLKCPSSDEILCATRTFPGREKPRIRGREPQDLTIYKYFRAIIILIKNITLKTKTLTYNIWEIFNKLHDTKHEM